MDRGVGMPYDVDRSVARGRGETEAFVLLQLDRPVVDDDLATITAPRRAAPIPQSARPVSGDDLATITAPRRAAPIPQSARPVFSDDSGHRAAVVRWAGRGFCLIGVLLCTALALTLRAHVFVPGLEGGLFGSGAGFRQARNVPSDSSSADAAGRTELGGTDVGSTGQPVERSDRTPAPVATTDTNLTAATPTGGATAPATVTADPVATVSDVPGSSAGKANPPALGKTKTRNPRAATPPPGGHGRSNADQLAE
jgi:hypothetical protein